MASRHQPLYPVLAAAIALGGLVASGCGLAVDEQVPGPHEVQPLQQQQADAGPPAPQPAPNEFVGGGAPYEAFDGGR